MSRPCFLPILLIGAISLASRSSELAIPELGLDFSPDKIGHFLIFGLLATLIVRLDKFRKKRRKGAVAAVICVCLFALIDEFHQSFTPGRLVETADLLADLLGAALAVFCYHGSPKYRKLLEWSATRKNGSNT